MTSKLDILVNNVAVVNGNILKGEHEGRTTNKFEAGDVFMPGNNIITIKLSEGSSGVLFFGHIEVLQEVEVLVGIVGFNEKKQIREI